MTPRARILIIDDDTDFASATRDLLEANGYEVLAAHDGDAGLKLAREHYPRLVILDVMMTTDTEGIHVSRKFKEDADLRRLPIILLTGVKKVLDLPEGLEPDSEWLPVRVVLEKPVPPKALLKQIAALLEPSGRE